MSKYRAALPQLQGGLFLTDAGLETDLIFNHGIEIREFAAHTLLPDPDGRRAVENYLRGYFELAHEHNAGLILDSQTWKAHPHWSEDLGESEQALAEINRAAIAFIADLRETHGRKAPVVLNGVVGPCGDAYAPEDRLSADDAQAYHAKQLGWLAQTEVDMVTAMTFTQSEEAIGFARAARNAGLPSVVSFTVETDGQLPTGQALGDAIMAVDAATGSAPAYYMVNCAHPDHFFHVFDDPAWNRRVRGLRCNASRLSHAELDACETLDAGSPVELAAQYRGLTRSMPWLNVFGGCCGSDLRHVTRIAQAVGDHWSTTRRGSMASCF